MPHDLTLLLATLALFLVVAKVFGDLFERMGQPAVLGELLAGVVLGNLALAGWDGLAFIRTDPYLGMLAELGVLVLLFEVGLESDARKLMRVGGSAFAVAVVGVIAPFALGYLAAVLLLPGQDLYTHLFIGAVLTATSVGITARVLGDLNKVQSPEGQIILGAAVIDDVLGLIVLAVVRGLIEGSRGGGAGLDALAVVWIVAKSFLFLGGGLLLGRPLSRRLFKIAALLHIRGLLLALSLAVCFAFSALAGAVGLAAIVGAFAAGLILEEVSYRPLAAREPVGLEEQVRPIATFLVPIFFVHTGAKVDLLAFADPATLLLAAALTVCAIVGKQVCGLAVGRGVDRLSVGIGMIPRGEVGLIFAAVGMTLGVVDARTNAAIVVMVFLTTLLTPPVLAWSLRRKPSSS